MKPSQWGWIKLHRKLLEKGYYKQSQYVHLWIHLLLSANHASKEYMTNGKIILIKEGQLLTGRKQLAEATDIPETTIERILNLFENEHQIGQQKTTKYRLITILNWKEHQERTPERTASGQQADTNKNDKNEKNTLAIAEDGELHETTELEEKYEKPRAPAKYPHSKEVFSWFKNPEPSWALNTTELKYTKLLYDRGEERVKKLLAFCMANKDAQYIPQWFSPSLLEKNWLKLTKYANANR